MSCLNFCFRFLPLIALFFVFTLNVVAAPGHPCGGVGGTIRSQDVVIPQRGGGTLNAKIFASDPTLQNAIYRGCGLVIGSTNFDTDPGARYPDIRDRRMG